MPRTGRPAGGTGNREAILAAAAHQFSERGYDRTSMRAVAAEAGVDQALIGHYFGSKHKLFIAAVEFPLDPATIFAEVLPGDRASIGERLARVLVTLLEDPGARRRLTGLVRAASSEPDAARMLRELRMRELIGPIAQALGSDEPELRVSLVGSQLIGLLMARYVVRHEPLASLPADRVADLIAPTLQRYLTHPLADKK